MAANGQLPASAISPIPGSGPFGRPQLRNDAARSYNALHIYAMQRWGISMRLDEGPVGRAYRSLSRQFLAKRIYGNNAATPGTSNHGLGINVDLMNRRQRWVMDQIGRAFGWSKACSDAAWEWWHVTYCCATNSTRRKVNKVLRQARNSPTLRRGAHGKAVGALQWHLQRRGYRVPKKGQQGHRQFGNLTERELKRFQRKHPHLKADGTVGLHTWRALRR